MNVNSATIKNALDYMNLKYKISQKRKSFESAHQFNIFILLSDSWYYENFISNLLRLFLDPCEAHHQEFLFLKVFIEFSGLNPAFS